MTETSPEELASRRLAWLKSACGALRVRPAERLRDAGPWIAVVCSRLGHDPARHRGICRRLSRSVLDCRARGGTLVYADGSAIASWAERAAELFGVARLPVMVGRVSGIDTESAVASKSTATLRVESEHPASISRDRAVIALADRVDALYVRRGGKIERWLLERMQWRDDATTRVAISGDRDCGGGSLVADGAIGWYLAAARAFDGQSGTGASDGKSRMGADDGGRHEMAAGSASSQGLVGPAETWPEWTCQEGEWLVHCTRGTDAAWPGMTPRQYLDSMLLGDGAAGGGDALETLSRIVRTGRLVAAAGATRRAHPVVCFSAVPLRELLRRRCYRPHLHRWDYEPYGVAIRCRAAAAAGVRPVIYGDPTGHEPISPEDRYRYQPRGETYDWTSEREWRSPGDVDLGRFSAEDVRVFVPSAADAAAVEGLSRWPVTVLGWPATALGGP